MPNNWFIVRGGKEHGPYTAQQIRELAATGKVRPDDLVRREDMKAPIKASTIKGLFLSAPVQPTSGKIDKAVPIDNLRRRLSAFAATIPHHDLKNLGDEITVVAASRLPVFRVEWTALFETREGVEREQSYAQNGPAPKQRLDPRRLDLWQQPLPPAASFQSNTVEVPLDATKQVRDCEQCVGHGAVAYHGCQGQQQVTCPNCNGSQVQACPTCGGSGMAKQSRPVQRQRKCPGMDPILFPCIGGTIGDTLSIVNRRPTSKICPVCNGTGVQVYQDAEYYDVPCQTCGTSGQICCQQCGGQGVVPCSTCAGHGSLTCHKCEGNKRLVKYLAVVQTHEPKTETALVPSKACPQECVKGLDETDFKEVLKRANPNGDLDTTLDGDLHGLSADVQRVRDGLRSQGDHACRVTGNLLRVERADVYRLDYSLDGKVFTAWFSGKDGPVHAPVNPLTDAVTGLVQSALSAWQEGRQDEAVFGLKKALQMAKADPACERALKPLKQGIPDELMRRASSFSFRFWWKHLSPMARSILGIGSAVILGSLFLCCGGFGVLAIFYQRERSATNQEITEANALWDAGDKAGAVAKYRAILTTSKRSTLQEGEIAPVYGRVIDYDVEKGDRGSAQRFIDEALSRRVTPPVNHPDAKDMLAKARDSTKKDNKP